MGVQKESITKLPQVGHVEKHAYLFGKKLSASLSPYLHSVVYKTLGLNWELFRLDSDDMSLFIQLIQHERFFGAAVTMPHKVSILPYLDDLEPECRAVGACNTVFLRTDSASGRKIFCGANTDVVGVRDALLQNATNHIILASRPGLIIGSGGAARSAVFALHKYFGVKSIYLVNRDRSEVESVIAECTTNGFGGGLVHVNTREQAESLAGVGFIISCVPDIPPKTKEELIVRDIVLEFLAKSFKGVMLEMCYNPSPYTALCKLAENEDWKIVLGTEAVIYQGLEQNRYWTGRELNELPVEEVKRAIHAQLVQKTKSARL